MRYTNYFGKHFNTHGKPHLSNDCFKKYFNMICLENKIHGMEILKKKYKGTPDYYKFNVEIAKLEKQIFNMTRNDRPDFFLEAMLRESADY